MSLDLYAISQGKKLRCGYTTGSCAAGAAKGAALMLLKNKLIDSVKIDTPAQIPLKLKVEDPIMGKDYASCAIVKDAGDDPDSTHGIKIYARVSYRKDNRVIIEGGEGIGRITGKGLFGNIGEAAINPVPRNMIIKELKEVSSHGYDVLIYAPEGKKIAKKTYNENIGIKGGISIIGTKGIVYPMSQEALLKTIYMEMDAIEKNQGKEKLILVPGNYGEKIAPSLGFKGPVIKISNFIGDSLLYAYNKGFKSITLIGHIGKLSKLSIGIFNTHSRTSDSRMEAFVYYLALMGAPLKLLQRIKNLKTAEEALNICIEKGYEKIVGLMEEGAKERIRKYLKDDDFRIQITIYSMEKGVELC